MDEQPFESWKCLAKNRKGFPCGRAKSKGKKRCRLHGGAAGSGAPIGNKNAFKHGHYSRESLQKHRETSATLREAKAVLKELFGY
jgi:uncharacterized protein YjcR